MNSRDGTSPPQRTRKGFEEKLDALWNKFWLLRPIGGGEPFRARLSAAGQPHTAWKLRAFDLIRHVYLAFIIEGGLFLAIFVWLGFHKHLAFKSLGVVALLLIGYIVADQILLSFSQGVVVSMGFPFILLTLLVESPLVAWLVATLGSLVSDVLRNHFFLYRDRVPRPNRLWRSLFYVGLHSLAAMAATIAYTWVSITFKPFLGLRTVRIEVILAYIVTYGLVSQLLIWPHDWLINKLVMPDQVRFPRVDALSALLVMTPIPVVLFYLYFQAPSASQWLLLLILPPAFFLLFNLMRSYVQVENERNRLTVVDFVHQEIKGTTSTMLDLTNQLMRTAFQLVRFDAIAIYGVEEKGEAFVLRGRQKGHYQTVVYGLDDLPPFDEGAHNVPQWPPRIVPGDTLLGETLRSGKTRTYLHPPLREGSDHRSAQLISGLPLIALPLKAQASGVVGLMVITKRSFVLAEHSRLEMLADEVGDTFRVAQMHERQIRSLYGQLEEFTRDQEQTRRAISELVQQGVELGRILAKISQQSYHTNLRSVLNDIIRGEKGPATLSLPDDVLLEIYDEVRVETPGMPLPTPEILTKIKAIISSLSLAFTFRYQFPDIPRGPEFNRLYQKFLMALEATTIGAILEFADQTETSLPLPDSPAFESAWAANQQMSQLRRVGVYLRRFEQTHDVETRSQCLRHARDLLDEQEEAIQNLPDPERFIFVNIINTWRDAITSTLHAVEEGQAVLRVALTANRALPLEEVALGLKLENVGTASATYVSITLFPADNYEVVHGEARVGLLPGGGAREVEFVVRPRAQDQIRPYFRVEFNDGQRTDCQEDFADFVYLRSAPPPFHPIQSPYVAGRPLPPGSDVFVGREDVFDFIEKDTDTRTRESILLLTGERRVGKTSIARQLPVRLARKRYLAAYLDCQSLGIDEGAHNFFLAVCDAIVDAIEDELDVPCQSPAYEELKARPKHVFERVFLPQVQELIGDRVLLLIIDEFEVLEDRVRRGKLDRDIFDYLRHLMQHVDGLGFIFMGTHTLQQLATDYWSVLFNIARHYRIGFLDKESATALITQPVRDQGMCYDDLAVQKIISVTGGHPYFIQLICDYLVGVCNEERRNFITVQDVRDALDPIVDIGSMHLSYVWLDSTPAEKSALYALTSLLDRAPHATQAAIADRVKYLGLPTDPREIPLALERLSRRSILCRSTGIITYCDFAVDLYRLWIKNYKVLDSVLEEVRNAQGVSLSPSNAEG